MTKKLSVPLSLLITFLAAAIWTWQVTDNLFLLFNFVYIGTAVATGVFLFSVLPKEKKRKGRRVTQLCVGLYMLIVVGFILGENIQIEGVFTYLVLGIFGGSLIHYLVAKIVGPFMYGRGWCGYACWTMMLLEFLPFEVPEKGRLKKLGMLRYLHFALSIGIFLILWRMVRASGLESHRLNLYMLAIGNVLFYSIGLGLALWLKDNRAFCKYICPITTILKAFSRFSLLKIEIDEEKCINCGLCEKKCPMDIKLLTYKSEGTRVLSTECINCLTCINACPQNAMRDTMKLDCSTKEYLNYRD